MAVLQSTSITGGLTMHGMSVGFMRLNAQGAVVMDTNTYLTGITSGQVTTALGYTPVSSLTDTLATVTARGASTNTNISVNGVRLGRDFSVSNRATIRLDSNGPSFPSDILFGHTSGANEGSWTGVYWSISSRAAENGNRFTIWRGGGNASIPSEARLFTLEPSGDLSLGVDSSTSQAIRLGGANAAGGRLFFQYAGDSSYIDSYGGHGGSERYRDLQIVARNLNLTSSGGNVNANGSQVVTNNGGTWGINVTGTAASETLATVTSRGATTLTDVTFGGNSTADQGIRINYGNYSSGYGRIRFMQDSSNHSTIHSFSAGWQSGNINSSTGAINIDGQFGFTIGAWNDPDATFIRSGTINFRRTTTISGNTVWHAGNLTNLNQLSNGPGYITQSTADGRYLMGTSNPGTVNNFTISIGNNGSYSYVQSHSSQPLELNPVGNTVRIAGNVVWHQGNLTNLNQLSNGPGYITGYTETDTLNSVTSRGNTMDTRSIRFTNASGQGIRWDFSSWTNNAFVRMDNTFDLTLGGHSTIRFITNHLNVGDVVRMSIDSGGTVSVAGTLSAGGDLRAPIFYDSNNTGYYLDPNSSGVALRIAGAIQGDHVGWTGEHNKIQWHSNHMYFQNMNNGFWIFRRSNGTEPFLLHADGYGQASGSWRAPIFFDSDNTGFYGDFASTSRMNIIRADKVRGDTNGDMGSSGWWAHDPYGHGWGQPHGSFRSLEVSSSGNFDTEPAMFRLHQWGSGAAEFWKPKGQTLFLRETPGGGGGWFTRFEVQGRLTVTGISESSTDMRAPIFYDSNDTGYYLDPNSASNLQSWTADTAARLGRSRYWTNRWAIYGTANDYMTGTNGWGTDQGNWDNAWKGGFSGWDIWGSGTAHPQGGGYIHAQGIVSGQHAASSDGSSAYGWMMVGAHNATENRYWLRGKWGGSTSGWVEMITTGNIGSQSVNYANSAGSAPANGGNSSTVGGYSVAVGGSANTIPTRNGSGYLIPENWIQLNGHYGLYAPINNMHLYPNNLSYGSVRIIGERNGWRGIHFGDGTGITLMMNEGEFGFHREAVGWVGRFTSGRYYGTSDNTVSISSAVGNAYQWTAIQSFFSNRGGYVGSTDSARLEAFATGGNAAFMSFHRSGNYAVNFGLDADNVMRIGGWSASANRWQLDMSGNMTVAGDVTAYSDSRVKENVHTVENALDKTLRMRGVTYNRTDSDDKKTKVGVIAQEMLEVLPEVVNQDNAGMYNVSYGNIVGVLIEAIKEQQKQIEELKNKLDAFTK